MALSDITDRAAVLSTIAEFDRIGRDAFLEKYRFGESRSYWLLHEGTRYDSKAIIGAAHGYARPDLGPMTAADFSGGEATVRRKLEELGFAVEVARDQRAGKGVLRGDRTSDRLNTGSIYTRDDLRGLFGITDATLNTGVFQPKGTSSVWLFITEEKTADRTQYHDRIDGDVLYWQGQTSGRTDPLIIQHAARGLELLVFMRKRKYEHLGAGFRYLGPFTYVRHSGGNPTDFVLQRVTAPPVARFDAMTADEKPYDPTSIPDGRQRTMRAIAQRRGQKKFRDALMKAYGESCAISGCTVLDVLEAAHIHPYRGPETNHVQNGLLLRADLHTLFDCGLIGVDPSTLTVVVDGKLSGSEYQAWHGRPLRHPKNPAHAPSKEALKMRKEERF